MRRKEYVMFSYIYKIRTALMCLSTALAFVLVVYPALADDARLQEQFGALWIEKDYEGVYRLVEPYAQQGDGLAQSVLGTLYHLGLFVGRDEDKAVLWYQRAAEQGVPGAQYYLGRILLKRAVDGHDDASIAINWIEKAANNRADFAASALADFYQNGYGVVQNAERAKYWRQRAEIDGSTDVVVKRLKGIVEKSNDAPPRN